FSRGTDEVETTDPTVASILAATSGAKPAAATPQPASKPASKPTPTPAVASSQQFVSKPMVQTVPTAAAQARADSTAKRVAPKPAPKRVVTASKGADTHMIQLGSYNSRAEANAGWETLKRKFAELRDRDVVITKAKVKGRIYYRVAAAGFGKSSARAMCGTVKSAGRGCFAYAATNPPKGAIDEGVRIAAR
ncbi:MAG: SPOR domain-containing protein, partial [Pseudomonadota bacterium]